MFFVQNFHREALIFVQNVRNIRNLRCEGKVYVMNAFGGTGDIVALVLSLSTTWGSVVSFTSRFHYPRRRNRSWDGPRSRSRCCDSRKNLVFCLNRTTIVGYPACSFVITSYAMPASKAGRNLTIIMNSTL